MLLGVMFLFLPFFFFNDTATTEIYTLSLHDALPTCDQMARAATVPSALINVPRCGSRISSRDRKSTRLNSSHLVISYAVFCLKKKKKINICSFLIYKKEQKQH